MKRNLKLKKIIKLRKHIKLIPFRFLKFKKAKWLITKSYIKYQATKVLNTKKYRKQRRAFLWSIKKKSTLRIPVSIFFFKKKQKNKTILYYKKNRYKKMYRKKKLIYLYRKAYRARTLFRLIDNSKIRSFLGRFSFLKKKFKEKIQQQILLKYLLNQNQHAFKKQSSSKIDFLKNLFSYQFTISGLIKSFFFYNTYNNVINTFKEKNFMLNNLTVIKNKNVKLGDMIDIKKPDVFIDPIIKKEYLNYGMTTYVEYDIYKQALFIIKNYSYITINDFNLMGIELFHKHNHK